MFFKELTECSCYLPLWQRQHWHDLSNHLLPEKETIIIIIIIKRISRVPIYRTRWEHRALYNNSNDRHKQTDRHTHIRTHTHSHMHANTHTHTYTHKHTHTCTHSPIGNFSLTWLPPTVCQLTSTSAATHPDISLPAHPSTYYPSIYWTIHPSSFKHIHLTNPNAPTFEFLG